MPSTIVHVAFAGMIAAALLGTAFDRRSLAVILGVVVFADLDAFVALLWAPAHRAAFHTLLIPIVGAGLVAIDLRRGEESFLRRRWGARGIRIAWVSLFVYAVAAIGLDLFSGGGANAFWPIHDQFYQVGGKIELSSQRGIVQNVIDLGGASSEGGTVARGSTETVHVNTGIDPVRGEDPPDADRVFPIVRSGWQLLILVVGTAVTAGRAYVSQQVE